VNVAYKIFSPLLAKKLSPYSEEIPGEYQCGFHAGRSTTEQTFVLRQSPEKCYEYGIDVHMLFIDYKQAFHSIDRHQLQTSLVSYGIPYYLINFIKMTSQTYSTITVGYQACRGFRVGAGVRHGDALSATAL
jgi:hypothetical protein